MGWEPILKRGRRRARGRETGSAAAGLPQEPDGGAEDVGRAEAAGLGDHGKVGVFASDQASPGDACLHLSAQDDPVRAQRPARRDGDVPTAKDQSPQANPARKLPGRPPQELAEGGTGAGRERGKPFSPSGGPAATKGRPTVGHLRQRDHCVPSGGDLGRGLAQDAFQLPSESLRACQDLANVPANHPPRSPSLEVGNLSEARGVR